MELNCYGSCIVWEVVKSIIYNKLDYTIIIGYNYNKLDYNKSSIYIGVSRIALIRK